MNDLENSSVTKIFWNLASIPKLMLETPRGNLGLAVAIITDCLSNPNKDADWIKNTAPKGSFGLQDQKFKAILSKLLQDNS